MKISNESLMKILKHQNKVNQLIMSVLENQPTVEKTPTQSAVISKDGVPLPRLLDKIKNVIGTDNLTIDDVIKRLKNQFPEIIAGIKNQCKRHYTHEYYLNYEINKKLKDRTRSYLSHRGNFIIVGTYNPHKGTRKRYSNNTV